MEISAVLVDLLRKEINDKDGKFGRMLADVFYKQNEKDPEKILVEGTYLNQELLDKGYAELYSGWETCRE